MTLFWRQLASLLGPPGPMPPLAVSLASPQAGDRRILLRAPQVLTIHRIDAVLSGGSSPSVSFSLRHGADISAAGMVVTSAPITTSNTTTGTAFTSFQNPQVLADHWLWLEIAAVSGSPESLTVSVRFS